MTLCHIDDVRVVWASRQLCLAVVMGRSFFSYVKTTNVIIIAIRPSQTLQF